ncbi:MAG: thiolase domain-containing protein [Haliea sp.]|nr:MAG: thiolase domain-containing protein [Haliea sp.]
MTGWHHGTFGRHADQSIEDMVVEATRGAIAHSQVDPADIDAIFIGHFNAGLVDDGFISAMPLSAFAQLRFKPAARVENACASGSAAVYQGLAAIGSGNARNVLVVGVEKMTHRSGADVTEALARAGDAVREKAAGLTFPGIFAKLANDYAAQWGDKSDVLAMIAAKNHLNGCDNRFAHFRKDLGYEFCRTVSAGNPLIAPPLRKTDCSPVSDGVAALVLSSLDVAKGRPQAVGFSAAVNVTDLLPIAAKDMPAFAGPARAWSEAYAAAGIGVHDLSFAEVHDCFTVAELVTYEAMQLTPRGQADRAVLDGTVYKSGALPVNASGGLKAKGHPVGASGVSMHVIAAMQLSGMAGSFQLPDASVGAVFNMGGSAVANYVSILRAR